MMYPLQTLQYAFQTALHTTQVYVYHVGSFALLPNS